MNYAIGLERSKTKNSVKHNVDDSDRSAALRNVKTTVCGGIKPNTRLIRL